MKSRSAAAALVEGIRKVSTDWAKQRKAEERHASAQRDRMDRLFRENVVSVKEAAQGPLKAFYEIHSNHRPDKAKSVEVSTQGLWRGEAQKFKDALAAARDRLDAQIPRLEIHVSPVDNVGFPNYVHASSIARISAKGCAIEWPGHVFGLGPRQHHEGTAHAERRCGGRATGDPPQQSRHDQQHAL